MTRSDPSQSGAPVEPRIPTAFVGHGSPRTAEDEAKADLWREWGRTLPRPEAILVVSAHWEDTPFTLGRTATHSELLYDFFGFPEHLYRLTYPAPGAPRLADRLEALLSARWPVARRERPLDHGAWMPLRHMFPDCTTPVLQVSMPRDFADRRLYELGRALAPLRDERVLILASGNIVHDIRQPSSLRPDRPAYAVSFDNWAAEALTRGDDEALVDWMRQAPEPRNAHPTPEHFRPLMVALGAAQHSQATFPVEGFEHGTVSRRCVQFG